MLMRALWSVENYARHARDMLCIPSPEAGAEAQHSAGEITFDFCEWAAVLVR